LGRTKPSSDRRFESAGKTLVRNLWLKYAYKLAKEVNRPINLLALASDDFSDIIPFFSITNNIIIIENNLQHYNQKKNWLNYNKEISKKITLLGPFDIHDHLISIHKNFDSNNIQYDLINLDYCSHYSPKVVHTLYTIISGELLLPNGYLFITLSRISANNKQPNLATKILAKSFERVNHQLLTDVNLFGKFPKIIKEFPVNYKNKNCEMHSFGLQF
jgi:hypothetical protein